MYQVEGKCTDSKASIQRIFVRRGAAVSFAKTLIESEVYDIVNREYIYGTSEFYLKIKSLQGLVNEDNKINIDQ